MNKQKTAGISAIVILGVLAVLLTIVVPLISRTTTDLRISRQQEEQSRAFTVAETGLERVLRDPANSGLYTDTYDGIDYDVTKESLGGSSDTYQYPENIGQDKPVTVWLVSHEDYSGDFDADSTWITSPEPKFTQDTLNIYWGEDKTYATDSEKPALEATLVYRNNTTNEYATKRYLIDSVSSRPETDGFDLAGAGTTIGDTTYAFGYTLSGLGCNDTVNTSCFFLRVRLLYSPGDVHPLAFVAPNGDLFPRQGECYDSLATVVESGVSSRVQRCILYRDFPPIMDFAMYSETSLSKI